MQDIRSEVERIDQLKTNLIIRIKLVDSNGNNTSIVSMTFYQFLYNSEDIVNLVLVLIFLVLAFVVVVAVASIYSIRKKEKKRRELELIEEEKAKSI